MQNQEERRKLIAQKIEVVHQKESRKNFIKVLPAELAKKFKEFDFIISPKDKIIKSKAFSIAKDIKENEIVALENLKYCYVEVSWEKEVKQIVDKFKFDCVDNKAYFWNLQNESPVFIVDFEFAKINIVGVWESMKYHGLVLLTDDYKKGIMIDYYGGYLLSDPNPNEIVYEIVAWGFEEE